MFNILVTISYFLLTLQILSEAVPYSQNSINFDHEIDRNDKSENEILENILDDKKQTVLEYHPHSFLSTLEIIELHGYVGEKYRVKTQDKYYLELHRIVGKTNQEEKNVTKPVILLMHGILASSVDWVLAGPHKALGFALSDAGYDVWLGNARGNVYSRKHLYYSENSRKFWDFSWHEIGIFDLPAKIDFILAKTGQKQLSYVGHSQGTTVFYVMTSVRPNYNDKIKMMFSLAPVSYMGNLFSPVLRLIARYANSLEWITKMLGLHQIKPSSTLLQLIESWLCKEESELHTICLNFVFMVCGYDNDQMNKTLLPAIITHIPAGASIKQLIHYSQLIKSRTFRQYDYGYGENMARYKSATPPSYDLKQITTPVVLFYSENDWLSHVKDVETLHSNLGNVRRLFRVNFTQFNHLDYLYGINADELLYSHVLSHLYEDNEK